MLSLACSLVSWSIALAPLSPTAATESPTRHVRTTDGYVHQLLRTGYERSPTFAALIARLEDTDVIVYVEEVSHLPDALEGRLLLQTSTPRDRYVRIQITRRSSVRDEVAVLGHELRHAVEVADATDVVDAAGMTRLYQRIGQSGGTDRFDTADAQDAGHRIRRELAL